MPRGRGVRPSTTASFHRLSGHCLRASAVRCRPSRAKKNKKKTTRTTAGTVREHEPRTHKKKRVERSGRPARRGHIVPGGTSRGERQTPTGGRWGVPHTPPATHVHGPSGLAGRAPSLPDVVPPHGGSRGRQAGVQPPARALAGHRPRRPPARRHRRQSIPSIGSRVALAGATNDVVGTGRTRRARERKRAWRCGRVWSVGRCPAVPVGVGFPALSGALPWVLPCAFRPGGADAIATDSMHKAEGVPGMGMRNSSLGALTLLPFSPSLQAPQAAAIRARTSAELCHVLYFSALPRDVHAANAVGLPDVRYAFHGSVGSLTGGGRGCPVPDGKPAGGLTSGRPPGFSSPLAEQSCRTGA